MLSTKGIKAFFKIYLYRYRYAAYTHKLENIPHKLEKPLYNIQIIVYHYNSKCFIYLSLYITIAFDLLGTMLLGFYAPCNLFW